MPERTAIIKSNLSILQIPALLFFPWGGAYLQLVKLKQGKLSKGPLQQQQYNIVFPMGI